MLKVLKVVFGIALLLAILGTLGLSIASLITVLNIQDTINSQFSTADPTASTTTGFPSNGVTTEKADPTKGDIVTVPTVPSTTGKADPTNGDVPSSPTTTVVPTSAPQKNTIPDPLPIATNDPRYPAYKGMSELLSTWMNTSVDPCDDFYTYTCGAGQKGQGMSFDVSDDAIAESMVSELRKPVSAFDDKPLPVRQMKWFYDSCMAYASEQEFFDRSLRIFNDLHDSNKGVGFPALFPTETKAATAKDLAAFLGYSVSTHGVTSIVDIGVDTDWKDPHNSKGGYALLVDQPAVIFIDTFYTKLYDGNEDAVVEFLLDTLNQGAKLLGIKNLDQVQAKKDAKAMAQLDYDLATKYSTDDTTRRQMDRSYNPYTTDGLQKLATFLDWKTFFNKAFTPIGKTVDGSFRSVVMEVDKLALLSADIGMTINSRDLNNYLYTRALLSLAYLPELDSVRSKFAHLKDFRRQKRPINRKIRREPRIEPSESLVLDVSRMEDFCQNLATAFMQWASSRVYVEANYPKEKDRQTLRDHTNGVIRSILVAFRAQIDLLDWMSPASKKGAYQKIDNLVVNIAYPDWVLDDKQLTDYYKKLNTAQNDVYLTQADKLIAFSLYEAFAPLVNGVPTDRTDFSGPAAITNAWYQPELNSITFPGGILHAPFYDVNYPAAMNYGGLGVIAGHELTHGFDDEGVQWEGTGILNSWMDNNSTVSFTKMAQCVVDEYSGFCPLPKGYPCVDGAQTQGENIADNGGIQAAYKAFKAYEALNGPDPLLPGDASIFNADQLFFLGFAQVWCQFPPSSSSLLSQILTDPHSPSLYRVLGTVQNMPAFQKAFNCPIDSVYAPSKHCNVWTSEPTSGAPLNDKGEPIVPENEVNVAPVERISPQEMDKYSAYQNSLAILKASANLTIDPCDDFYHYSCGNFPGAKTTFNDLDQENYKTINNKINDPDYQSTLAASTALTKLKNLYDACLSEKKNETISAIDYIGTKVAGFKESLNNHNIPIIGDNKVPVLSAKDFGNVLGYLSFKIGVDTLVSPGVDTNWKNPQGGINGYLLFIDEPSPYKTHTFYEEDNWNSQKAGYKKTVKTLVEAYAKQAKITLNDKYDDMIEDALDLERTMAIDYSRDDTERRLFEPQWNPRKFGELPTAVDWNALWGAVPELSQDIVKAWIETGKTEANFILNEPEKTPALFEFLAAKKDDTIAVNYLFIRLLLANSGLIPCSNGKCAAVMSELATKEIPQTIGRERLPRRGGYPLPSFAPLTDNEDDPDGVSCADSISAMADAQGRVYVDAKYPTENDRTTIRTKTQGVMHNIVDGMKGMIEQLDWMNNTAKAAAIEKANNIQVNVAFPDSILDNDQLDAEYEELNFSEDDSYFVMLDDITEYSINQDFKKLNLKYADRTAFSGQVAVVNAWYSDDRNAITFPAGILQQPFFDVNYPAGLNYGGLGVVAGHELTHGFDDKGVQWDKDGALNGWLDEDSQAGFNNMAQCVIDEYSKFCPLPDDRSPHCTNGVQTQGENIADNGGIHSAWRAFQYHTELDGSDALFMDRVYSQYTNNQLYFLNFAQVWCMQKDYLTESYVSGRLMTDAHALGPYRVLGTLQNTLAFQANFNCPRGSTYAPEKHCSVWVPTVMA